MSEAATAKTSSSDTDADAVIVARGLSRRFGDFVAVKDMDLRVDRASIYGFLGPNGSGKTTTIRMLCGLLTPSGGEVEVLGCSLPQQAEALRQKTGYMTQRFSLFEDLTVLENLRFMGQIYGIGKHTLAQRIAERLSRYHLEAMQKRRPAGMSGGQKQRLALAAATLHEPQLLFLDEPTSAVDPENRRDFWEKLFDLCDQGTTILVSTHYMDEAERCHKLLVLEEGEVRVEGEPETLMRNMGAHVVEIFSRDLHRLKSQLHALPEVLSSAQQGVRLRVLVSEAVDDPRHFLQQAVALAPGSEMELVHPSLEDVFVLVTGNRR